jgi:hypothetical protein
MEETIEGMKTEMNSEDIASDFLKLGEISKEIEEKEAELSNLLEEWETLCTNKQELEEMNNNL